MGTGKTRRAIAVAVVAFALMLQGCTDSSSPYQDLPPATSELQSLADALTATDLTHAPLSSDPALAQDHLDAILSGMQSFIPHVTAGDIEYSAKQATATGTLHYAWDFPSATWTYDVSVPLEHTDAGWRATWAASIVHPSLTDSTGLFHTHLKPTRAGMLGQDGSAIVEDTDVVNVGIDKTKIQPSQFDSSARALAAIVGVNPDTYAAQVRDAGPQAFVVAITFRQYAVPPGVADVPGSYGQRTTMMLAPTSTFGQPLIGRLHEATAEDIANSDGSIVQGEYVGSSGIQAAFDKELRGVPGDIVYLSTLGQPTNPRNLPATDVLFDKEPEPGTPIHVSFSMDWQQKAEDVLAAYPTTAAAVIVQPSTGAVLAAANTPGWGAIPDATAGAYAPGSTFKVIVALALLRKGYTPKTSVNCTATATAGGVTFKNVSGYPGNRMGWITLEQALANSCNTAFINQLSVVSAADLADAAGSLGFGTAYPSGAGLSYGSLPSPDSDAMKAMEFIGQGGVLANPLAMAGVAASVAAGHTVVPWVVQERKAQPTATPLAESEAAQLRQMMALTISDGGATSLQGWVAGGKTGTAQWGPEGNVKTHAWMIAFTDSDLAMAVWVKEGAGGAAVAGPIIKQLLS